MPKPRLVGVNARGNRVGQDHPQARLTDRDVELLLTLLEARSELIELLHAQGVRMGPGGSEAQFKRALRAAGLSLAALAAKFDCSKTHVRSIATGRHRGQYAVLFKRCP